MEKDKNSCTSQGLNWWATLIVAVLAVPSFGFIVYAMFPAKGLAGIIIFIAACWLCTFLGMKLMQNPQMKQKIDFSNGKKPD